MAVVAAALAPSNVSSSTEGPGTDGTAERQRLRTMLLIRRFEEKTYQEYTKPGQKIGGFCHLYSGQEAISVGLAALFDKKRDYLINGYRCHGHSLALGMDPRAGFAAYEQVLRPYVDQAQKLPPGTPRLANPKSRAGIGVFHAGLRVAAALPPWVGEKFFAPSVDTFELKDYGLTG